MTPTTKRYLIRLLKKEILSAEHFISLSNWRLTKGAMFPEVVKASIVRHELQKKEAKKVKSEIEKIKFPRKKQVKKKQ